MAPTSRDGRLGVGLIAALDSYDNEYHYCHRHEENARQAQGRVSRAVGRSSEQEAASGRHFIDGERCVVAASDSGVVELGIVTRQLE